MGRFEVFVLLVTLGINCWKMVCLEAFGWKRSVVSQPEDPSWKQLLLVGLLSANLAHRS